MQPTLVLMSFVVFVGELALMRLWTMIAIYAHNHICDALIYHVIFTMARTPLYHNVSADISSTAFTLNAHHTDEIDRMVSSSNDGSFNNLFHYDYSNDVDHGSLLEILLSRVQRTTATARPISKVARLCAWSDTELLHTI